MTDELFKENQLNLLQQVANKLDEILVKFHENEILLSKNQKEYFSIKGTGQNSYYGRKYFRKWQS